MIALSSIVIKGIIFYIVLFVVIIGGCFLHRAYKSIKSGEFHENYRKIILEKEHEARDSYLRFVNVNEEEKLRKEFSEAMYEFTMAHTIKFIKNERFKINDFEDEIEDNFVAISEKWPEVMEYFGYYPTGYAEDMTRYPRFIHYWLFQLICSKRGIITEDAFYNGYKMQGAYIEPKLSIYFCREIERNLRKYGFPIDIVLVERNKGTKDQENRFVYDWRGERVRIGTGYRLKWD